MAKDKIIGLIKCVWWGKDGFGVQIINNKYCGSIMNLDGKGIDIESGNLVLTPHSKHILIQNGDKYRIERVDEIPWEDME